MARKRWTPKTEITPELLKFREKRKWQIALRRYAIDKLPSTFYAPYFGLEIESLRKWLEIQFIEGAEWDNFGKRWQIEHYVPVTYFDFSREADLRLCWNFINLKVEILDSNKGGIQGTGLLGARTYLKALQEKSGYQCSSLLLEKIDQIERESILTSEKQIEFIQQRAGHLEQLGKYTDFEFELLNKGRSIEEVNAELEQMKKIKI
jgi:hypothetical protein